MQKILYAILIIVLVIVVSLLISITAINLYYFVAIIKGEAAPEKDIVDYVTIMLTCIALCFSISIIIPYFLSNQIIKREIEKTVNDIFDRDYKVTLNETINSLERGDADHSRMTAIFLQKHQMYLWSIGWICRSILRYLKCDKIPQQKMYADIIRMCVPILIENINKLILDINPSEDTDIEKIVVKRFNNENFETKNNLTLRTLTDVIDYRISISQKINRIKIIENADQKEIVDLFVSLILSVISEKEIYKCAEMSWFSKDIFMNQIQPYRSTALSCNEIYKKLSYIATLKL